MEPHTLLSPGRNCWRIEHAQQTAFLVDGAGYFKAFREAAAHAEQSILILGWDFDTRVLMLSDGESDGLPITVGDFLCALLVRRPALHNYVLIWDFHVIYAFEREWWPVRKLWPQRRLHLGFD